MTVGDSIAVGQNLHTVVVVCPQDPDGDGLQATDEGETAQVVLVTLLTEFYVMSCRLCLGVMLKTVCSQLRGIVT